MLPRSETSQFSPTEFEFLGIIASIRVGKGPRYSSLQRANDFRLRLSSGDRRGRYGDDDSIK